MRLVVPQLRLAGTPVEAAIVRRLFPTPEETTAAPTSPRRAGSQAPPQRGTQGGSQGDGGGDGVSPSPSLTGRQLTVLLEAVTASGVALGEEALQLVRGRQLCALRTSARQVAMHDAAPTDSCGHNKG